jgi:hypothetical protein
LIKDHSETLTHFQELLEQEREEVSSKHGVEINEYKTQIELIKTELSEKLDAAEVSRLELIGNHETHIETLTTEKDGLISAAETSKAETEKRLGEEIAALTDAMAKATAKIMVISFI